VSICVTWSNFVYCTYNVCFVFMMSVTEMKEVKLNGEGCVSKKIERLFFYSVGHVGIACIICTNMMSAPKQYYFWH